MGGKVLDLPEFRIFDAGKAEGISEGISVGRAEGISEGKAEGIKEGRAEGENERKELSEEVVRLKAEIEELKKRISS